MKKKFILLLIIALLITGCSFNRFIKLTYDDYVEKCENNDSFLLTITQSECGECNNYKKNIKKTLRRNEKISIYNIEINDFQTVDRLSISAQIYLMLGEEYYSNNNLYSSQIPTPITINVVKGEMNYYFVGNKTCEEIENFIFGDMIVLNSYHDFIYKCSLLDNFIIYISEEIDKITNYDERVFFLDYDLLTEENINGLLNRINYFYESIEQNTIESLKKPVCISITNGLVSNIDFIN